MSDSISRRNQNTNTSPFEAIRHTDDNGQEYWSARELMIELGYAKWQRFEDAIERAQISCEVAQGVVSDHFTGAGKVIITGKGAHQELIDYHLTRYACYLIAMNGDPRKTEIANAQRYFAQKTREAELQVPGPNHEISLRLYATYECLEERVLDGYWSIITELCREVHLAELTGHLDGGAFPEISVGRRWAKYAREVLSIDVDNLPRYQGYNPLAENKIEFPALLYPLSLQRKFRYWFRDQYLPFECKIYIASRTRRVTRQISAPAQPKRIR